MKKFIAYFLFVSLLITAVGCDNASPADNSSDVSNPPSSETVNAEISLVDTSAFDFEFSKRDKKNTYDQKDVKNPTENENSIDITSEGTYIFSGDINKMITVSVGDEEKVQIVLDNANLTNENGPCIYIKEGDKVFITLKEGTENKISDGTGYDFVDGDSNVDGAIFSRSDLTINGKGSLSVFGKTKHAVVSKDDLNIVSATLSVFSVGVALDGKDCVKISDANLTLSAGSDGIRSDNAEDENRGFVYIESGKINITSGNDGIQAETVLKIDNADINIVANGGSSNTIGSINSDESYKGLKSAKDVIINNGVFNIDSMDDSIHANNSILINNGEFNLKSSDDGIHADLDLQIANGKINVKKSYEGLEASKIVVSGGEIDITASDDGLNAAGGNDGSGMQNPNQQGQQPEPPPEGFDGQQPGQPPEGFDGSIPENPPEGFGGQGGNGKRPEGSSGGKGERPSGNMGGGFGGDMFGNGVGEVIITGGNVLINASGDGIDSNGTITVSGGVTLVSGPTNNGNGALDYQSGATVKGGVFVALGSSGMAQGFSNAENQGSIFTTFQTVNGGTKFALCDSNGKEIVSFTPDKAFSSVVVSTPEIQTGNTYSLVIGDTEIAKIEMTSLIYGSGGMGMGGKPGRR